MSSSPVAGFSVVDGEQVHCSPVGGHRPLLTSVPSRTIQLRVCSYFRTTVSAIKVSPYQHGRADKAYLGDCPMLGGGRQILAVSS
jgi:hypothetical protein